MFIRLNLMLISNIQNCLNTKIYYLRLCTGEVAEDFGALDVVTLQGSWLPFLHSLVFVLPVCFFSVHSFFQPFRFFASFPSCLDPFFPYFFVLLFLSSFFTLISISPSFFRGVFRKNLNRQVLGIHQHHPNNFTIQHLGSSFFIPLKLFGSCLS